MVNPILINRVLIIPKNPMGTCYQQAGTVQGNQTARKRLPVHEQRATSKLAPPQALLMPPRGGLAIICRVGWLPVGCLPENDDDLGNNLSLAVRTQQKQQQ